MTFCIKNVLGIVKQIIGKPFKVCKYNWESKDNCTTYVHWTIINQEGHETYGLKNNNEILNCMEEWIEK